MARNVEVSSLALAASIAALAAAPDPTGIVSADGGVVDPALVEQGLRARLGEGLDGWRIDIGDGAEGELTIDLVRPDATRVRRRLHPEGSTVEDRSRELAAALAIIVGQWHAPPADHQPAGVPRPRMFALSVGPRLGLGAPPAPDLGGTVVAAWWVAREHLQPRVQGAWSASWNGELLLHAARVGGGLAAGSPLGLGRLWLGGVVIPQAVWLQARDRRTVSTWSFGAEAGVLAQVRGSKAFFGLRTGVDLLAPPVAASGVRDHLRWGSFRYIVAFEVGLRL